MSPANFKINGLKEGLGSYDILILHRHSNVDNKETFSGLITAFDKIAEKTTIVFLAHPNTKR